MTVLMVAQCLKCDGVGTQINYKQGHDVKSRCGKCGGRGFHIVKHKPNRDFFIEDVSYYNGRRFIKTTFYCNAGFCVKTCFKRFNKAAPRNQRIATKNMRA